MIKPPFTILVLKNAHRPLTIRITAFPLFLFLALIPAIFLSAGIGLAILILRDTTQFRLPASVSTPENVSTTEQIASVALPPSDSVRVQIGGLFAVRAGGGMEISFTPTNLPPMENCYVWFILSAIQFPEETVIYPRSPVFRGVPVDYRNGVPFFPSRERQCSVTVADLPEELSVDRIRILIYSSAGEILADSSRELGRHARM